MSKDICERSCQSTEPAFDLTHPPKASLIADCVHCGFCLPTCPTYVLWGQEMDSPRGRIHLMRQGLEGEPLSDSMVEAFDNCLGCMACVSACPSGVQYNLLIEAARSQVERRHQRPRSEKLIRSAVFALFPHPSRLRAIRGPLRLYQRTGISSLLRRSGLLERISPQLAVMESLAPELGKAQRLPERVPARGARRGTVGMLLGCVQREFFPDVNSATARVLSAEGYDVIAPSKQGCCGALSAHYGRSDEARVFARKLIDVFEEANVEAIVVNAAGCGSTMKEYADLLDDDPAYAERAQAFCAKTVDVSQFLASVEPVAPRHRLDVTIAYHDACHLGHAQGIRLQPRDLLTGIPGVTLKEIPEAEICCGSAGIYNVLHPQAADELGARKAANVIRTGADLLVTANPGCLMQVASALEKSDAKIGFAHIITVLDASLRGASPASLLPR